MKHFLTFRVLFHRQEGRLHRLDGLALEGVRRVVAVQYRAGREPVLRAAAACSQHVGHFALATGLMDLLGEGGRVVALSSAGHRFGDVDLDDPNFERTGYDPWVAYGRSKTANALFALTGKRIRELPIRKMQKHS